MPPATAPLCSRMVLPLSGDGGSLMNVDEAANAPGKYGWNPLPLPAPPSAREVDDALFCIALVVVAAGTRA